MGRPIESGDPRKANDGIDFGGWKHRVFSALGWDERCMVGPYHMSRVSFSS